MLFDESYKTIETAASGIFKDRGSRFVGFAFPVKTDAFKIIQFSVGSDC